MVMLVDIYFGKHAGCGRLAERKVQVGQAPAPAGEQFPPIETKVHRNYF